MRFLFIIVLLFISSDIYGDNFSFLKNPALAHPPAGEKPDVPYGEYIANEGVLVVDGETKILFDPLFHSSYGNYLLPSDAQREAIINGQAPFDGVDAMFITHAHGDHFSAEDAVAWLAKNTEGTLIAPKQAVQQLEENENWQEDLADRVIEIELAFGEEAKSIKIKRKINDNGKINKLSLKIDAVRIPHAGWPSRKDIENIVYRVSLDKNTTVMHLGDADPNDEHYVPYNDLWQKQKTQMGFPPYWFFLREGGAEILSDRLNIEQNIGVHVPVNVPEELKETGVSYFSKPGEWHPLKLKNEKKQHEKHKDEILVPEDASAHDDHSKDGH